MIQPPYPGTYQNAVLDAALTHTHHTLYTLYPPTLHDVLNLPVWGEAERFRVTKAMLTELAESMCYCGLCAQEGRDPDKCEWTMEAWRAESLRMSDNLPDFAESRKRLAIVVPKERGDGE